MTTTVTIFTKPGCIYCTQSERIVEREPNVKLVIVDLTGQSFSYETARDRMVAWIRTVGGAEGAAIQDRPTLPQVFFGNTWISGGCIRLTEMQHLHILTARLETHKHEAPVCNLEEEGREKWNTTVVDSTDF